MRGLPSANARPHGWYSAAEVYPEPRDSRLLPPRLSAVEAGEISGAGPASPSKMKKVCAARRGAEQSGANLG